MKKGGRGKNSPLSPPSFEQRTDVEKIEQLGSISIIDRFSFFFFSLPLLSFLLLLFFLFFHALSPVSKILPPPFFTPLLFERPRTSGGRGRGEERLGKDEEGWRDKTNALFGTGASLLFTLHLFYFIFRGINVFGGFASRLGKYFHNTCLPFPTLQRNALFSFFPLSFFGSSFSSFTFSFVFFLRERRFLSSPGQARSHGIK